jgi:poly-gamma-glutamate capsule biosynthesis protein CapA/YwtB (metallophosphatase superfamily)
MACGDDDDAEPITFGCLDPCDLFQIVWVGDILLGDAAQPLLDQHGYTWPFEFVRGPTEGDYLVGNAEGPITELTELFHEEAQFDYNAQPESADALGRVGFDALSLANNHAMDRGPEGLADTIGSLDDAGVATFGAGQDLDAALTPLLIQTPHGSVAVLGFEEEHRGAATAAEGRAGVADLDDENLAEGIRRAREAGAEWVVAFVHWGSNYSNVDSGQRILAPAFATAGYDLVIGHHPHVQQKVDIVDGMPVLYSLGNFVFGTPGRFNNEFPGYGFVARTYLGPDGFEGVELTCILTDNDRVDFQPRPCDEEEAREVSEGLGPLVTWRDGVAVLGLPDD